MAPVRRGRAKRRGKIRKFKVKKPTKTKDPSGGTKEDNNTVHDEVWGEQLPSSFESEEELDDGSEVKRQMIDVRIYKLPDLDTDMFFEEISSGRKWEIVGIGPEHGLPEEQVVNLKRYIG